MDLLILPEVQRNWVSDVDIQSLCFSDHSLVRCRFGAALHRSPVVSFSYRRLKQINLTAFRRDIAGSLLFDPTAQDSSVDEYTDLLQKEVTRVLDLHSPLLNRTKRQGAHDGRQLSREAREAKCTCRRLERQYRRTGSALDKAAFVAARPEARGKIKASRVKNLSEKVASSAGDPKSIWRTTRDLLHSSPSRGLDDEECAVMVTTFSRTK